MTGSEKKETTTAPHEQWLSPQKKTLVIGYGNPDREDDGVAWHVLVALAERFNKPVPDSPEAGIFPEDANLDLWFNLQLMPEMADEMTAYDRICFVDAHTGAVEEEIHWKVLESRFQNSPLTHHMTPETIMSILEHLYHHTPEAVLVSIRGYQFGFHRSLSERTQNLCDQAVAIIVRWIKN